MGRVSGFASLASVIGIAEEPIGCTFNLLTTF